MTPVVAPWPLLWVVVMMLKPLATVTGLKLALRRRRHPLLELGEDQAAGRVVWPGRAARRPGRPGDEAARRGHGRGRSGLLMFVIEMLMVLMMMNMDNAIATATARDAGNL